VVLRYPTRLAVGTSSLIMAMTAASGTIGYALHGAVDYSIGIIIAVSAVISGLGAARLANKVSEKILNRIAGTIFGAIGVLMLVLK
jgi:uncharacterized protein